MEGIDRILHYSLYFLFWEIFAIRKIGWTTYERRRIEQQFFIYVILIKKMILKIITLQFQLRLNFILMVCLLNGCWNELELELMRIEMS